jgi:hypothetical protein
MVRYRDSIRFMMPGTVANPQNDIMIGDTQGFVVQHLGKVHRLTFRAAKKNMLIPPEADEIS